MYDPLPLLSLKVKVGANLGGGEGCCIRWESFTQISINACLEQNHASCDGLVVLTLPLSSGTSSTSESVDSGPHVLPWLNHG